MHVQVYTTPKTLRAVQRSTTRLTDVLQGKDHGEPLAKALLIDLALAWTFMQRQNRSLKGQEEKHRRALSGAVDRCRAALLHYSAFLVESLGSEGYAKLLPSMIDMHAMGLQPELVFHLWRPCLAFQEGKGLENSPSRCAA